jgi:multiple sugar transport system substrate-binding protein
MLEKIKKYSHTFYLSIGAITVLAFCVLAFMLFWDNGLFQPRTLAQKVYYADNISPTHQLLIDIFNKKHKGEIEIVPINLPFEKFGTNERKELLIRHLRSKSDRIDIFSVDQIWVPRFAKWTEPLNRYITKIQRDQIIDEALKTCYYKNDLVAMPIYFDLGILYVNNNFLLTQPDNKALKEELNNFITWERFIEISRKLNYGNRPYYLFPADNYEGLMCSFIESLANQDNKLFIDDKVKLTTPASEKALQLLVDLVNRYKLSPKSVLESRETDCYRTFINDDGVFLRGWTGLDVWYKNNIDSKDISDKYFIVPLPHFKGGKPASIVGGWNMMISKLSTKKSEAVEFLKFMISEEAQEIMLEHGGYFPINKKIYANPKLIIKSKTINLYNRIIKTSVHRPFLDKYTRSSDIIAHYLNSAIKKEISIREALSTAERVINSGEFFIK